LKPDTDACCLTYRTFLAAPTPPTPVVSTVILAVLEGAPDALLDLDVAEDVAVKVKASIGVDQSATARPAREAKELMRTLPRWEDDGKVQAALK
jgi:hypothetical protein